MTASQFFFWARYPVIGSTLLLNLAGISECLKLTDDWYSGAPAFLTVVRECQARQPDLRNLLLRVTCKPVL